MSCSIDLKSKYLDWGCFITKYMPHIRLSDDNIQLYCNFMILIALAGPIPNTIQVYKIWKTKEVKGISPTAFIIRAVISLCWLIYGLFIKNGVVILSGFLITVVTSILVYLVFKYSKDEEDDKN